ALHRLAARETWVVRIVPPESPSCARVAGEIRVSPQMPQPLRAARGDGRAAKTLAGLARAVGWRVAADLEARPDAVVVATMGHGDEDALEAALRLGAGYVGLVASAKRAGVVLEALRARGVDEEALARVRSPA